MTSGKPEASESDGRGPSARPAGLGEKSVKNVRATLAVILDRAKVWGYLDALPDLPKVVAPPAPFDWYRPFTRHYPGCHLRRHP